MDKCQDPDRKEFHEKKTRDREKQTNNERASAAGLVYIIQTSQQRMAGGRDSSDSAGATGQRTYIQKVYTDSFFKASCI